MVSFANPEQIEIIAEVCQSFSLDNGAFSMWRSGTVPNWSEYYDWVATWKSHPGCDWAVIPDVIDGTEEANDELLCDWPHDVFGVPVWHLHESLERLNTLVNFWPRVAIGSSGQWANPGSPGWWQRMAAAMDAACDDTGRPLAKLHGLRMLSIDIYPHLPLTSADSTNVARNVGLDGRWRGPYQPSSKVVRGEILVRRIESHNSSSEWAGCPIQKELFVTRD